MQCPSALKLASALICGTVNLVLYNLVAKDELVWSQYDIDVCSEREKETTITHAVRVEHSQLA